ncbi:MAG: VCBS repeat-containing protein [Planctomycetales bacterium]
MFYSHRATKRSGRLNSRTPLQYLESRTLLSATPLGVETRVNPVVAGDQTGVHVARNSSGATVVTWASTEGGDYDVYAQRFNAWGAKLGITFRVNATAAGDQYNPSVAIDEEGNFVIAWQSSQLDGSGDIYFRRFNAFGGSVPTDILVNSNTALFQSNPEVAMDSAGNTVIVWQSNVQSGNTQIIGQRILPSGTGDFLGSNFTINRSTAGAGDNPDVAMGNDGKFIVTWQAPDGSGTGIYAAQYAWAGGALTNEFRVNSASANGQYEPSVAADPQGNYVIAWTSDGEDGDQAGVYAQLFNAVTYQVGSEFQVNTTTSGLQNGPDVTMAANGNFVITWSDGSSISPSEVMMQQYSANGTPNGLERRVNTYTSSSQYYAHAAMDATGNFVITWISNGQDGSGSGIYSQFYTNKTDYVGVQRGSIFFLDSNHNDNYEGGGTSVDDTYSTFGAAGDKPVVGDWNGDGFDDIGIWRSGFFYLDANGNGVYDGPTIDRYFAFGLTTDTPVAGDWNGDGIDDIGVWRAGKFYLDTNSSRSFDSNDGTYTFGTTGDTPIIGDWNGDGKDDIGVWRGGLFYQDLNGNHKWDRTPLDRVYEFGLATDKPIIGDWNGDGKDDIGVKRAARFWIDGNANGKWDGAVDDYFIDFGNASGDVPLVGFWRPRAVPGSAPAAPSGMTVAAPASEQVAAPTITAAQIDPGVTRKSGTAKSTAINT